MVQRTFGVGVGVVVAALLGAGAASGQERATATVVLRDGRRIEAARVGFRERTFVVRTTAGEEQRLDERDVLRVELAGEATPERRRAAHPPLEEARVFVTGSLGEQVVMLAYRPGALEGVDATLTLERRERPTGAWREVGSFGLDAARGPAQVCVDEEAAWPRRYDYRLTTTAVARAGYALADADVRRVVTVEDVEGPRRAWVTPAAIGSEVVVAVRRPKARAQVRAVIGEPLVVEGVPVGARVASIGREADGSPSLHLVWDGAAAPEVVRADASFGDPWRATTFVGQAASAPARATPRAAIDLRQATLAATARALGLEAGGAFALVQADPAARIDLRLRAATFDQAAPLVAELLGRRVLPWAGLTALSAPDAVADRLAPPPSVLTARLDGERVAVLVSAPEAYDLPVALDLFAAATGIDVVLSAKARQAAASARAAFVRAPAATLAQALTLLTGAGGVTWTTRGEVILVKAHDELGLDEVWLDLDIPEGTTLEALAPALRASGIELWSPRHPLGIFGQPRRAGRVALAALLEGLSPERRGIASGVGQSIYLDGPARASGVTDVFILAGGRVELRTDDGSTTTGSFDALGRRLERARLWATDPDAALQALQKAGSIVVAVNGRPLAPPASPAPPAAARAQAEPRTLLDWRRLRTSRPTQTDAQLQAALELARMRVAPAPEDPEALVALGRASLRFLFRGDEGRAAAARHFEAACAVSPGHVEAWFHRGLCAALQESELGSSFAFAYFGKALELSLGDVDVLLSRAQLQVLLGRAPDAREDVEAVVRSAPGRADGWACMAQVRWSLGDREGALQAVGEALKLAPEHPDVAAWRELAAELERAPARGSLAELEARALGLESLDAERSTCVVLLPGGRRVSLAVGSTYDGHVVEAITLVAEGEARGLHLVFARDGTRRSVVLRASKQP